MVGGAVEGSPDDLGALEVEVATLEEALQQLAGSGPAGSGAAAMASSMATWDQRPTLR